LNLKEEMTMALSAHRPRVILIAGPYRSGSGDIPLVSLNLGALEAHPLALWRAGHISRPRRSFDDSLLVSQQRVLLN
jgi:hypothetical protein